MNDSQLMHAMSLDDTYRVEQVLARGEDGITELVTIDGAGPFVRKRCGKSSPAAMFGRHSPNAARLASPESRPPTQATKAPPTALLIAPRILRLHPRPTSAP